MTRKTIRLEPQGAERKWLVIRATDGYYEGDPDVSTRTFRFIEPPLSGITGYIERKREQKRRDDAERAARCTGKAYIERALLDSIVGRNFTEEHLSEVLSDELISETISLGGGPRG